MGSDRGEMTQERIRRELGELLDQLVALPSGAIRERAELAAKQEELSKQLASFEIEGSADIKKRWDEAAGSKTHKQYEIDPVPVSSGEGGGGV